MEARWPGGGGAAGEAAWAEKWKALWRGKLFPETVGRSNFNSRSRSMFLHLRKPHIVFRLKVIKSVFSPALHALCQLPQNQGKRKIQN